MFVSSSVCIYVRDSFSKDKTIFIHQTRIRSSIGLESAQIEDVPFRDDRSETKFSDQRYIDCTYQGIDIYFGDSLKNVDACH